ncbi:MAG: hypothetical protein FJ403_23685 [Verrucomicrobia bacterium]|nr:hypothetical protein [Verrucomicrobiota bacterium]
MADIQQNTLYLTTPGSYVARDHLTLQVEAPIYPAGLEAHERTRDRATDWRNERRKACIMLCWTKTCASRRCRLSRRES